MHYQINKQHRFIKIITVILSLVTLTACFNFDTASVDAKAKTSYVTKHHKKIQDKTNFVIAKSKKNFKKGYKYRYNRQKKVYYGRKIRKVKQKPNTQLSNTQVSEAPQRYPEYNHPSKFQAVNDFTDDIIHQYHLNGTRWATKRVTYNDNNLSKHERALVEEAAKQINNLNIVTLVKTSESANITMTRDADDRNDYLAITYYNWGPKRYKGLKLLDNVRMVFYETNIDVFYYKRLLWNQTALHEFGHALGLAHTEPKSKDVMEPAVCYETILTNDDIHTIIDQGYINSLTLLYDN